jgi:hypothetical protein
LVSTQLDSYFGIIEERVPPEGYATAVCSVPVSVLATVSESTVAAQQIELSIGVATMRLPMDVSPLYIAQLVSALQ